MIDHLAPLHTQGKKHIDMILENTTICQFLARVTNLHLALKDMIVNYATEFSSTGYPTKYKAHLCYVGMSCDR